MTCSCRYIRRRPAVTRTRTTSPLTERKREVARRPATAAIPTAWEYAPAPESREVVHLEDRYGLFIGGQFVEPLSNERYTTIDPAREAPLAVTAKAGKADVDRAVKAARAAYAESWSRIRPSERAKYLFRIARILQERSREFAVLESMNGGKPIRESRDVDLPLAAAHFFYYAGSAERPRTSSSTTRRSIRPSKGSSTGSTSTRGTCAALGRGSSSRNRSTRPSSRS